MSRVGWKVHYIVREASGCNLVIQMVRDSAFCWFKTLIQNGEFEDCIELLEIVTDNRGRVIEEHVTHSYSKYVRQIVEHVSRPRVRIESVSGDVVSVSLLGK
jgi:hypothetical protein